MTDNPLFWGEDDAFENFLNALPDDIIIDDDTTLAENMRDRIEASFHQFAGTTSQMPYLLDMMPDKRRAIHIVLQRLLDEHFEKPGRLYVKRETVIGWCITLAWLVLLDVDDELLPPTDLPL